ncbi:MAG: heme o synthase [Deinococcaceae bacterium]
MTIHNPTLVLSTRATWRDYFMLTKPKVISLLLFTTLTAMFMAERGMPNWGLLLVVALGGYLSAGASGVLNMVIDHDIDLKMERTSKRPTASGLISRTHALYFGLALAVVSYLILGLGANWLAANLSLAGLLTYVFVYTLWLKRTTWHNIVIGGAAGCFPPLVGWSAVTGDLNLFAWYLFAIIFFWTPVHFWALAIMIKQDYAAVRIPMLPVVHGDRATVTQIILYSILTVGCSIMPLFIGELGWIYGIFALILNALLLNRVLGFHRKIERKQAVSLYLYSMLYLALLFLSMAVDRTIL